jgi:transposase
MSPTSHGEAAPEGFYDKLRQHLAAVGFDRRVSELCQPMSWTTYPDPDLCIDPVVYFKMLMIGYLENLSSERAIARHCSDSLSIRALLGFGPKERTPSEHELGAIRHRLEAQVYEEVLDTIVRSLKSHGLLDGGAISQEMIEENVNLRGLINRNTVSVCRSYFNGLTGQPSVILLSQTAAEPAVLSSSYKSVPARTRHGISEETSEDPHQARWCRRLGRRG